MLNAEPIVLTVLAGESALDAYSRAVYFDQPDAGCADLTGLFALSWLACDEIKQQIEKHCPPECVPVQTLLHSRRFRRLQRAGEYRLEVRLSSQGAGGTQGLQIGYSVRDSAELQVTSGKVDIMFMPMSQLSTWS